LVVNTIYSTASDRIEPFY